MENQASRQEDNTRNVIRLGWVSLLTDISSEMLYAITPLFLTQVLGASKSVLGLIEGVAEGTASVLKGVSGWHSDRIRKRKEFIFTGYSLSALAKPLMAIAGGWPMLLVARFMDRFGKGVRTTARDALIADSTPPEKRGWAFGLHRAMDTAGALIGVAFSLFMLFLLTNKLGEETTYRTLYWLAFIPAVMGVIFIFYVKEMKPKEIPGSTPRQPISLKFGPRYYKLMFMFGLFTLANSSDTFLLLRAKDAGWTAAWVIGAYLCYNVSYSLLSLPMGKLADHVSKEKLMGWGIMIYALVYLGFAWMPWEGIIWPLFLMYGVYIAMTEGVSKALISNLVGSEVRGTAMGLFNMVVGGVALIASLMAGILWDQVSSSAPFFVASCLAFAAGVWFLMYNPESEKLSEA